MDPKMALNAARMRDHPIESDPRINSPKPTSIRDHRIPEDRRVTVPRTGSPFRHGIHLGQRVPTPPALAKSHDLLEDRQITTPSPSPSRENHNLASDARVSSPGLASSLPHDSRVGTPKHSGENIHDLAAVDANTRSQTNLPASAGDAKAPTGTGPGTGPVSPQAKSPEPRIPPPPKRVAAASPALSAPSTSIGTRAHQLLEHFLERDRKGLERRSGNKS